MSMRHSVDECEALADRIEAGEFADLGAILQFVGEEWNADDLALLAYILEIREYARYRRAQRPAQRRALALFRSLLTPAELAEYRRTRYVTIHAFSHYRLYPNTGVVQAIERHGSRWYVKGVYCYHEPQGEARLPNADRSVAHLLLLRYDEEAFLREANVRWLEWANRGWDGQWRRVLRGAQAA